MSQRLFPLKPVLTLNDFLGNGNAESKNVHKSRGSVRTGGRICCEAGHLAGLGVLLQKFNELYRFLSVREAKL